VRGTEGIELHEVPHGHVVWQLPSGMPVGFASERLLLVRDGHELTLWNVDTGEQVSSSPDGLSAIWTVEPATVAGAGPLVPLRHNGRTNGFEAGPITVWDAAADLSVAELPDVGRIHHSATLAVSDAAELFAFPDPEQTYAIRLFDLRLGAYRRPLLASGATNEPLQFGRFNQDGSILAAQEGGLNTGVRLWNTETGEPFAYLHDHENPVWSPDGRFLAVVGAGQFLLPDGMTRGGNRAALLVYEVAQQVSTATVRSRPSALMFRRDGLELAVQGSRFEIGDQTSRYGLRPVPSKTSDDGKFVATGGGVWRFRSFPDVKPPEPVRIERVFPDHEDVVLAGVTREEIGSVQDLAVSPDGKHLLLVWRRQVPIEDRPNSHQMVDQLELWDLVSRSRVSVWAPRPERTFEWGVLRFSPDGQLAVTSESGYLFLRDVATGEVLREARIETIIEQRPGFTNTRIYNVVDAAFTPDGDYLVCGGEQGRIAVFDVATGKVQTSWDGHDGDVSAIAISPDSRTIASAGDDRLLRLWDLATGRELARWEPHQNSTTVIQFSPDGRGLATACSDGTIRLWDLPSIRQQLTALELDW
jgi:WD40 repeat protein